MVENLGEALEINFVNKHTSAPATAAEIAHDFEAAETGTSAFAPDDEEGAILHLATGEEDDLFAALRRRNWAGAGDEAVVRLTSVTTHI